MNPDNKPAPNNDDDLPGTSHAADEPTAVWDEQSLRAAGLSDLLRKRPSDPPPQPATPSDRTNDPSIVVDRDLSDGPSDSQRPDAVENGFGWPATVAVAVVLGAIVYFLIRFLRG